MQTTVAKVESGERPMKLWEAYALANVLQTSVADLVDEDLTNAEPSADPVASRRTRLNEALHALKLAQLQINEIMADNP